MRGAKFKACIKCKFLVEHKEKVCPVCGSTEFSDKWKGQILVFNLSSELAKALKITKEGVYAIQVF